MKTTPRLVGLLVTLLLCSCSAPQGEYAKAKADQLKADQARAGDAVRDFPIMPDVTKGATPAEKYGRPQ